MRRRENLSMDSMGCLILIKNIESLYQDFFLYIHRFPLFYIIHQIPLFICHTSNYFFFFLSYIKFIQNTLTLTYIFVSWNHFIQTDTGKSPHIHFRKSVSLKRHQKNEYIRSSSSCKRVIFIRTTRYFR